MNELQARQTIVELTQGGFFTRAMDNTVPVSFFDQYIDDGETPKMALALVKNELTDQDKVEQ